MAPRDNFLFGYFFQNPHCHWITRYHPGDTPIVPSRGDNDYVIIRLKKKWLPKFTRNPPKDGFPWVICFLQ